MLTYANIFKLPYSQYFDRLSAPTSMPLSGILMITYTAAPLKFSLDLAQDWGCHA